MLFQSQVGETLFLLADPRRPAAKMPQLTENEWQQLFALSGIHGVLGIVLGNLKDHDHPTSPSWQDARRRWRAELVISLRLRRHANQVIEALTAASIPASVIKGIDFADHLYPQPNLRPTRDVDVLIPKDYWDKASEVLEGEGYFKKPGPWMKHEFEEYGELCWRHRTAADIAIELHWNLVRNPTLRRRASFGYNDLNALPNSKFRCASTASRLVVAAIHAVITHQFDRLLLLCDIREASRQIVADSSVEELRQLAEQTRSRAAIDVALAVTARLFKDPDVAELRQRLGALTRTSLSSAFVSKGMLVHPTGAWPAFRRSALREWLKRAA